MVDSSFYADNTSFTQITATNASFMEFSTKNNETYTAYFFKCYFYGIYSLQKNVPFISIISFYFHISIIDSTFSENSLSTFLNHTQNIFIIEGDLIYIEKTINEIVFENVTFNKNIISRHAIHVNGARELILNKLVCKENNYLSDKTTIFENEPKGGCFRMENILNRYLFDIEISECFSDKTSFGITIIDKTEIISSLFPNRNYGKVIKKKN